jgi:hypothetical protein
MTPPKNWDTAMNSEMALALVYPHVRQSTRRTAFPFTPSPTRPPRAVTNVIGV